MTNRIAFAVLPALGLLSACGGGEITTTNSANVVANDAYANTAFRNDGEAGNEIMPVGVMDTGEESMTSAGDAMMGNTPDAANATMGNMAN